MIVFKTADDIKNKISNLMKSKALKRAKDLISIEDLKLIESANNIVKKYSSTSWGELEFVELQQDVLNLQSILVAISISCGDIMSNNDIEYSSISTSRSKIRLDAKKVKKEFEDNGEKVKVTVEDIKDISYVLTEDESSAYEDQRLVGQYMKMVYFAIKDQVQLMEKALQRVYIKTGERV